MKPHLWNRVEEASGDPDRFAQPLQSATAEQMILLRRRYGIASAELRDRASFRDHAANGHADLLARWVVGQGERTYGHALKDPTFLPDRPPADAADLYGTIGAVYAKRFGHPIPDQEPPPTDLRALGPHPAWVGPVWGVIELVQLGIPIEQAVSAYTRSELIRLATTVEQIARHSVDQRLRDVWPDEDSTDWDAQALYAVSQGREAYEALRAAPEQLPDPHSRLPPSILSQLHEVYWSRYGDLIPAIPPPPPPVPSQGVPAVLWPLVGTAPAELRERLADADAEQLILLHRHVRNATERLLAQPAFAPDRPTEAREALAGWVLAEGRAVFDAALHGTRSLPDAPPPFEDRGRLIREVFEARFVAPMPDREPWPRNHDALGATPAWTDALWALQEAWLGGLPFEEAAAAYARSALACLSIAAAALVEDAITDEAWAVLGEDPEEMGWITVSQWMVAQGRSTYDALRRDPSLIPREPPEVPLIEMAIADLYEERYGASVPSAVP